MTKQTIIEAPTTLPQIVITREFAAPRDLVYRAYTDPDLLARWWGPRSMTTTIDALDTRHGGAWRVVHSDADGNRAAFRGVFHGTPSPDAMVRTFEFEGMPGHIWLETATFEQRGDTTTVRSNTVFQTLEDRDGLVESGMDVGVDEFNQRLDELLATLVSK